MLYATILTIGKVCWRQSAKVDPMVTPWSGFRFNAKWMAHEKFHFEAGTLIRREHLFAGLGTDGRILATGCMYVIVRTAGSSSWKAGKPPKSIRFGSFFHLPHETRNQPCDSTAWLSALPPFLAFARFLVSSIVPWCRWWCLFCPTRSSRSAAQWWVTVVGTPMDLISFRHLSLTTTTNDSLAPSNDRHLFVALTTTTK